MRIADISPLDTVYTDKGGHDVIVVLTTDKLYTGRGGFGDPEPGGKKIMAIVATDKYARSNENLHADMIAIANALVVPSGPINDVTMPIPAGTFLAFLTPAQIAGEWKVINARLSEARLERDAANLKRRKAENERMDRGNKASALIDQLIPGYVSHIGTDPRGSASIQLETLEALLELAKKGKK